uniref:Uncharacterized protein n=1 Tax=Arundo donax TaxID=35708 RepID=A0A0A9H070_ARUDO
MLFVHLSLVTARAFRRAAWRQAPNAPLASRPQPRHRCSIHNSPLRSTVDNMVGRASWAMLVQ